MLSHTRGVWLLAGIVLLVGLNGAVGASGHATVLAESPHADLIDVSGDRDTQVVQFAVAFEKPGDARFAIDTSALPAGVRVADATADGPWDPRVVSTGEDETVVEVDSGNSTGDVGVEVIFELDTTDAAGGERTVEYHIIAEETGDTVAVPVEIADAGGEQVTVEVAVETPTGEQLSPSDVEVWAQDGATSYHGMANDGESFRVSAPSGTYHLRANADGYAPGTIQDVTFDENSDGEQYTIRLQDGGTLQGTVTDTNGDPVPDARVEVTDTDGVTTLVHADADGSYEAVLSPGAYSVRAWDQTRVSDDVEVVSIDSTDDVVSQSFTLRSPEVVDAELRHVGGTLPDMDALDVRTTTQGGLVFVEIGPDAVGETQDEAFTPQDVSAYGVDESTTFEITLTVENFDPDSLLWAARDVDWEVTDSGDAVEVTVRVSAARVELIEGPHLGPTVDGDEIDWPTGDADVADESYERAVQFALVETPGLNPVERDTVRGMSVTTNAQVFGFPQVEDGELSVYLGAPGERTDGEDHVGYYSVFLPDSLLDDWEVENPEEDLEAMWKGDEEAFTVTDRPDGAYVTIEPVTYSDGTMTVRSTEYEETFLDKLPSLREIWHYGNVVLREIGIRISMWLAELGI